jgi:hypothetical protein
VKSNLDYEMVPLHLTWNGGDHVPFRSYLSVSPYSSFCTHTYNTYIGTDATYHTRIYGCVRIYWLLSWLLSCFFSHPFSFQMYFDRIKPMFHVWWTGKHYSFYFFLFLNICFPTFQSGPEKLCMLVLLFQVPGKMWRFCSYT